MFTLPTSADLHGNSSQLLTPEQTPKPQIWRIEANVILYTSKGAWSAEQSAAPANRAGTGEQRWQPGRHDMLFSQQKPVQRVN